MEQKLTPNGSRLYCETVSAKAPTVVLIHNMWGSHKTMHRHVKLFRELGYNTVTFNLDRASREKDISPIHGFRRWRFSYLLWIDHITDVLNSIPGEKIIFSFSGPSLTGLIAAHARKDIKAYICDGGPFDHIWSCTLRMFAQETKIPTLFLRVIAVTIGILKWGPWAVRYFHQVFAQWPTHIPILSIRGMKDPIVPAIRIQSLFSRHAHISLRVVELAEGLHLDGLKKYPEIYSDKVKEFLTGA